MNVFQKKQNEAIKRIEEAEVKRVRKLLMLGLITDDNSRDYQDYFRKTRGPSWMNRRLSITGRLPTPPSKPPKITVPDDDDVEKVWKVKPRRKKPDDYRERNIMTYASPPKLPFLHNGTNSPPAASSTAVRRRYRTETPAYSPDCSKYPIMSPRRLSVCEKTDDDADELGESDAGDLKQDDAADKSQDDDDGANDVDGSLLEYLRTYDDSLGRSQHDDSDPWWSSTGRKPKPPRSAIRFKYNGVSTTETRYIPPRTPEPVKDFLQTQRVTDLYREAEALVGRR